jgi:spore coat polysaccharide biosynthesis protein SpsF
MIGCIIQARMGSTRLPGKVMKIIDGKNPSLQYTLNQLKSCKSLDKIIVATTNLPEDDEIVNYLKNLDIDVFRGSSDDVLDRYFQCAKNYDLSSIVRITADCALIDPNIVEEGIKLFNSKNYDYVTNTFPRTFPDGNETEIFSINALEEMWKNAKLPSEREHVTPYFKNNPKLFQIKNFIHNKDISDLRWTIDYDEDLKFVKILISKIQSRPIHLDNILHLLNNEPKLLELNKNHKPNEGYVKSLEDDKNFLQNQ